MKSLALVLILFSAPCFAKNCDASENLYVLNYSPGPTWKTGAEVWDQDLKSHAMYMAQLLNDGKLKLGGPFTDSTGGMAVICVKDSIEAEDVLNHDPAIQSQIMVGTIKEWFIAFDSDKVTTQTVKKKNK
jgi:uncharacterized protein YciI